MGSVESHNCLRPEEFIIASLNKLMEINHMKAETGTNRKHTNHKCMAEQKRVQMTWFQLHE